MIKAGKAIVNTLSCFFKKILLKVNYKLLTKEKGIAIIWRMATGFRFFIV
jgi:hypothetical protein